MKQETKNKILGYCIMAIIMPLILSVGAFLNGHNVLVHFGLGVISDICFVAIIRLFLWIHDLIN